MSQEGRWLSDDLMTNPTLPHPASHLAGEIAPSVVQGGSEQGEVLTCNAEFQEDGDGLYLRRCLSFSGTQGQGKLVEMGRPCLAILTASRAHSK